MNTIPTELIEKALALTWRTMEDVNVQTQDNFDYFLIEKFYAYLLSPEFIEKYIKDIPYWVWVLTNTEIWIIRAWKAIWNHQSWNSQPLIDLLTKI